MVRPLLAPVPLLAAALSLAAALPALAAEKPGAKEESYAVFVTSRGRIAAKLLPEETPAAVANFVALATGSKEWTDPRTGKAAKAPLYDGTLFHRVIPGFMIQGGDPATRGRPVGQHEPSYGTHGPGGRPLEDELLAGERPFDKPCQLAYANSGPNTNGSQFFLTEVSTPHLNPRSCREGKNGLCGYVRFGVGVCGCERVREIAAAGNSQTRLDKVLIVHQKPTCK